MTGVSALRQPAGARHVISGTWSWPGPCWVPGMPTVQLTARSSAYPLVHADVRQRTWAALRRRYPAVLAACFMGNHLHLLVEDTDPDQEIAFLGPCLRALRAWRDLEIEASVASTRTKVRRDLRYIALNPCRARLAADPLEWLWSTHRELVGAVPDPWVDHAAVRRLCGPLAEVHRYVSSDPSVQVSGTPLPRPAEPRCAAIHPLASIRRAARVACRGGSILRRGSARVLFLHLAHHQGWRARSQLAEVCGMSPQAVGRCWRRDVDLLPARLCLGDRRLLEARLPSEPGSHRQGRPTSPRPPRGG